MQKQQTRTGVSLTAVAGSLAIVFLLGIFIGATLGIRQPTSFGANIQADGNLSKEKVQEYLPAGSKASFASINVPAVDDEGNGVVTALDVQVSPGSGKILTNIDKLFFWVDTQNSIRKATKVAEDITGKGISQYDIVYTVRANASVIEGGSAGAALTIATIAGLQNKTINSSVMITGTIEEDGSIGPIGEVVAKAIGAKEAGAKLFLVPNGQGSSKVYRPLRNCYSEAGFEICETKTVSEKIFISKDVGIEVREVKTVSEAMQYFFAS